MVERRGGLDRSTGSKRVTGGREFRLEHCDDDDDNNYDHDDDNDEEGHRGKRVSPGI